MDKKKLLMPASWLAVAALLVTALFAPVASANDGHHGDGWHYNGHWHWECDRGTPKSGPTVAEHGTSVKGMDWEHEWSHDCWKPTQDPCATASPVAPTSVSNHDVVCPTPVPTPTPTPTLTPTEAPTPTPTASPTANLPSGDVGGETGNPNITPPPTDGASAVAAVARSWTTLLLAVVGLLASVLVLTPMAIRRRR